MDENLNDMISELKISKDKEDGKLKIITVTVKTEKDVKLLNVEIVSENKTKAYLGGYRNIETGVKYFNANSQTTLPLKTGKKECFSRSTQTIWTKHQSQQVCKETFTQTPRKGFYFSSFGEKVISARPYKSSDEIFALKLQTIKVLQRHCRKFVVKRRWMKIQNQVLESKKWKRAKKLERDRNKQKLKELEEKCKLHPEKRVEFEILFNRLQIAYLNQVKQINDTKWGAERYAALSMVTDIEANIIREINAKRKIAMDNKSTKNKIAFLKKAAAPKVWKLTTGEWNVETVNTLKGQELKDLYCTLTLPYLKRTERIDALLTMIQIVQAHDCELTKELIHLAEREISLLERGIKDETLQGLHLRILTLFWSYVSQPLFNPETSKLSNIPTDPSIFKKHLVCCNSCNCYFTVVPDRGRQIISDVPFYSRKRQKKCPRCIFLENEAIHRKDTQVYERILKNLWNKERNLGISTGLVFFLKKGDIRYLVEKIWKNQSPISGNTNLDDLVLTRWNRDKEWMPWNSILLTEDEAEAHDKIESISDIYAPAFFKNVERKQLLASVHFSSLPHLLPYIETCLVHKLPKLPQLQRQFIKVKSDKLSQEHSCSAMINNEYNYSELKTTEIELKKEQEVEKDNCGITE
ncbi:IQ motif and ubiquitin-like domain-containing protein isoform X1 [Centruroides vittatus]|uniref:IQ motif and ubiquitin-like domain-containing protein isoform X1 n=1 Tax=Centruroides vittatus TaxID=120091 RepID=UPI003510798C